MKSKEGEVNLVKGSETEVLGSISCKGDCVCAKGWKETALVLRNEASRHLPCRERGESIPDKLEDMSRGHGPQGLRSLNYVTV